MSLTLLGIESLMVALIWLALGIALSVRRRHVAMRIALGLLAWVPPFGVAVYYLFATAMIAEVFNTSLRTSGFAGGCVWTGALAVGAVVIACHAYRRSPAGSRSASTWPVRGLGFGLILLAALTLLTFWTVDAQVKSELADAKAQATARALALLPDPPMPVESAGNRYETASHAITDAELQLDEDTSSSLAFDMPGQSMEALAANENLRLFLEDIDGALRLAREAASMPRLGRVRDVTESDLGGGNIDLLTVARWLEFDGKYHAATGDFERAISDWVALERMQHQLCECPLLIDLLVIAAIAGRTEALLGFIVEAPDTDWTALATVAESVPSFSFRQVLQRGLLFEHAFGVVAASDLFRSENYTFADFAPLTTELSSPIPTIPLSIYRVFYAREDLAAYDRGMRAYRQAATQPLRRALEVCQDSERDLQSGILATMILANMQGIFEAIVQAEADQALRAASLAVAAYAAAHDGALPEAIDTLTPDYIHVWPLDPYTGDHLIFTRSAATADQPDSILIYSVGPDLQDNGGVAVPPGEDGDTPGYDWVIRIIE